MPTRNVNLTDHFDAFVAGEISAGRYRNASEVMRAGLRLLERQTQEDEQRLAALRALALEGFAELDEGRGIALGGRDEIVEFVGEIGRRSAARPKRKPSGS